MLNSDFDCRFFFARPIGQHLSPWLRRDVIETPFIGELAVNGWDLATAFKLLLKGNAVIIEWLRSLSSIVESGGFATNFLASLRGSQIEI